MANRKAIALPQPLALLRRNRSRLTTKGQRELDILITRWTQLQAQRNGLLNDIQHLAYCAGLTPDPAKGVPA